MKHIVYITTMMIMSVMTLQAGSWHDKLSTEKVSRMIQPYFSIQESLAKDDLENAHFGAKSLRVALKGAPSPRESILIRKINDYAIRIKKSKTLDDARRAFAMLTTEIQGLVRKHSDELNTDVYAAYCPMAFDGQGGAWLQEDKEIRNPYYGASMLECGKIRSAIATTSDDS